MEPELLLGGWVAREEYPLYREDVKWWCEWEPSALGGGSRWTLGWYHSVSENRITLAFSED